MFLSPTDPCGPQVTHVFVTGPTTTKTTVLRGGEDLYRGLKRTPFAPNGRGVGPTQNYPVKGRGPGPGPISRIKSCPGISDHNPTEFGPTNRVPQSQDPGKHLVGPFSTREPTSLRLFQYRSDFDSHMENGNRPIPLHPLSIFLCTSCCNGLGDPCGVGSRS